MRPGRRTHRSIPVIGRYSTKKRGKGCAIRRGGFQTVRNSGTLEEMNFPVCCISSCSQPTGHPSPSSDFLPSSPCIPRVLTLQTRVHTYRAVAYPGPYRCQIIGGRGGFLAFAIRYHGPISDQDLSLLC